MISFNKKLKILFLMSAIAFTYPAYSYIGLSWQLKKLKTSLRTYVRRIENAVKEEKLKSDKTTNATMGEEGYYLGKVRLRVRPYVTFKVPGLAMLRIRPFINLHWSKGPPNDWDDFKP